MFLDASRLQSSSNLECDVAVAGGGVAGIIVTLELARKGIDVVLLESGGEEYESATDELNRTIPVDGGVASEPGSRCRFLGGSSNCWGGWCRPLEPEDFAKHEWVPDSGWPIDRRALEPYYRRCHEWLGLGPYEFDSTYWSRAIASRDVRAFGHEAQDAVVDSFSQFSRPVRMGKRYRQELSRNVHARVLLHANLTQIEVRSDAQVVDGFEVTTIAGARLRVRAKRYVLAMGGIENPRLLLASNRTRAAGLGNERDLVGRYFMDHPRFIAGGVRLASAWERNRLYNIRLQDKSRRVLASGTRVAANLVLRPELRERERLLNARVWFRSLYIGESSPSVFVLRDLAQRYIHRAHRRITSRQLLALFSDPIRAAAYATAHVYPRKPFVVGLRAEIMVEPAPIPSSRVTLQRERDALGVPRVAVDWRLDELVHHTARRTLGLVGRDLEARGIARLEQPHPERWPETWEGTWHHMGTTRMSESPETGVVDADCRLHGIANLFIAGSSVFPTAGSNFPTMTLAALAIRLADHLFNARAGEARQ